MHTISTAAVLLASAIALSGSAVAQSAGDQPATPKRKCHIEVRERVVTVMQVQCWPGSGCSPWPVQTIQKQKTKVCH